MSDWTKLEDFTGLNILHSEALFPEDSTDGATGVGCWGTEGDVSRQYRFIDYSDIVYV